MSNTAFEIQTNKDVKTLFHKLECLKDSFNNKVREINLGTFTNYNAINVVLENTSLIVKDNEIVTFTVIIDSLSESRFFPLGKGTYFKILPHVSWENMPLNYKERIVGSGTSISNIRKHSFLSNTSYNGYAVEGSLEIDSVWTVTKLIINSNGTTVRTQAINIKWTDRYVATYI